MENKLRKGIRNNNGLYEAIFDIRGIKYERTELIWYSREETPPLYSNMVTASEEWVPDDIFHEIDLNYEKEKWAKWSIKDSFGLLDLREYGFTKLFDAQWIYLNRTEFVSTAAGADLRYEIIDDKDTLSEWRLAWDADERLGKEIFAPVLLDDPGIFFVAGYYKDGQIVSGCLVNETDDVLGISNFFAPDENAVYWTGMVSFIFAAIKKTDIVGYERKETVNELQGLGFRPVGNLAVWLKKRNFET